MGPSIQWGSASDGTRIYVAVSNPHGVSYSAGNAGSWAALDPATGKILWQKADPNGVTDTGSFGGSKRHRICTLTGGFCDAPKHVCAQCNDGRYAVELSSRLSCERGRRDRRWRWSTGVLDPPGECATAAESVLRVLEKENSSPMTMPITKG